MPRVITRDYSTRYHGIPNMPDWISARAGVMPSLKWHGKCLFGQELCHGLDVIMKLSTRCKGLCVAMTVYSARCHGMTCNMA